MRLLAFSILLAAFGALIALPQESESPGTVKHVTYFLIDSSGSMKGDNEAQAEIEVLSILNPIKEVTPTALVSRTYFRAENRDLCSHPLTIVPPVPASESERQYPTRGNNDYTQLGTALESAILAAGNGPAEIFLLSDEVQTPDCGPDVCEVARMLLPRPDIRVTPIAVGENAKSAKRLQCVVDAQVDPDADEVGRAEGDENSVGELIEDDPTEENWKQLVWRNLLAFTQTWLWLIGVLMLTGSALALGFRESDRSRIAEERTKKARELQGLIRTGDQKAQSELNSLNIDDLKAGRFKQLLTPLNYPVGLIGLALLSALAFLPPQIGTLYLKGAKDAAWYVFNSDFATAFAVTWIAIIFFAGGQTQRRREAKHNFELVTEIAKRTALAEQSETRKQAFAAYEYAVRGLRSLATTDLLEFSAKGANQEKYTGVADDAELVSSTLFAIAVGSECQQDEEIAKIRAETSRLNGLTFKPFFQTRIDFRTLIERLEQRGGLDSHLAEWKNLRLNWSAGMQEGIFQAIGKLAACLRS